MKPTELDSENFKILTEDDMREIRSIRQEYIDFVNTLGEEEKTPEHMEVEETPEPMEIEEETPEPVQVETSSKRPRSVSNDENSKPKMRKVNVAMRSSIQVIDVPKNHDVITKHKKKQLQNKANKVEAVEKENSKLKAENAKLEMRNEEIEEIIKAIGKQFTFTNEDTRREIDQGKCLVSELSRKVKELQSHSKSLHHSIEEKDKRIQKLEKELEENEEAIVIGKKMLRLPTRKKCPSTPEGLRLYSLMCSTLPGGSFKNFQVAIALGVAAFFADNGLGSHYDSLEFIPYLTPSDKTLDRAVLIHEQFVLCKVANYFNKGAIASACHDKGNRAGLGRLILILAFFNYRFQYDKNWRDAIISVTLNCDGVKSKDANIADHINKKLQRLRPYMHSDAKIQLSSATTDAGGGGGTKENCMLELEKTNPDLMYTLTYVLCCLLHAHNLPLQLSWEKHFGPFGIDKNTMSQCAYNVTYLFELLGESFKPLWFEIIGEDWNDLKLLKVILTRWLYAIQSVSKICEKYEKIKKFCKAIYEAKKSTYLAHKVAKETYELLENPEVRCMMEFVKAFGEYYWTPFYNWARRKGSRTKKEGHIANEVLIRIFNAERQLSKLEDRKWLELEKFAECKRLREGLATERLTAVDQRFDAFIKEYIELAFRESCFGRWTTKTLVFGIATENKRSAQVLTNFILHKIDNAPLLDVTDEVSEKTEIHMRYKEKEFQEFLVRRCKPIEDDPIIVQHHEALKEMNAGVSLYDEGNVSDNMKMLQQTRDDVILTAKAHSHEAELGVQKIAHCMSAVNRSEMAGTAMSVAQSFDHQIVTSKHTEILQNRELKGNQHTKRGKAGERDSISEESKRKAKERETSTLQDLPRSQAGREKASLFIRQAKDDPYPDGELFQTMRRLAIETKKMKQSKSDRIAIDINTHREEYAINQERKQGLRRGKFRDGDALKATELDATESNKEGMRFADWKRKCQMRLLIQEIIYATYPGLELDQSQNRSVLRSELEKIKTLTALKSEYAKVNNLPEGDERKSIVTNLVSPTCIGLGDSRVRTWDKSDEEHYLQNVAEEDDEDEEDEECTVDIES